MNEFWVSKFWRLKFRGYLQVQVTPVMFHTTNTMVWDKVHITPSYFNWLSSRSCMSTFFIKEKNSSTCSFRHCNCSILHVYWFCLTHGIEKRLLRSSRHKIFKDFRTLCTFNTVTCSIVQTLKLVGNFSVHPKEGQLTVLTIGSGFFYFIWTNAPNACSMLTKKCFHSEKAFMCML